MFAIGVSLKKLVNSLYYAYYFRHYSYFSKRLIYEARTMTIQAHYWVQGLHMSLIVMMDSLVKKSDVTRVIGKMARLTYYSEEPTMQAAKQEALNTINQLPENTDMDEIMYRLYVLDKIRKGQEAVEQGKTITSEELKQEIDSW